MPDSAPYQTGNPGGPTHELRVDDNLQWDRHYYRLINNHPDLAAHVKILLSSLYEKYSRRQRPEFLFSTSLKAQIKDRRFIDKVGNQYRPVFIELTNFDVLLLLRDVRRETNDEDILLKNRTGMRGYCASTWEGADVESTFTIQSLSDGSIKNYF